MGHDAKIQTRSNRNEEWAARQQRTRARFNELKPLRGIPRRAAEDAIVLEHLDLVDGLVRRVASGYRDQGDLRQVGCIGLMNAVRRFDPQRGDNFISFAVPTIAGEIKRHLRDNGWFIRPPRRMQEMRLAPIITEHDRADLLLALECVEAVLVFDEDTPTDAVRRLEPDLWVEGGDYRAEELAESIALAEVGGRAVTVPYHPARSTSALAAALAAVS